MEGKVISLLILFALTVGGAAWVLNITTTNEIEGKVTEAKAALRGVDRSIEQLTVSMETVNRSKERILKLAEKTDGLDKQLQEARKKVTEATSEAVSLESQFANLVAEVRKNATGTTVPQMTLASGKVLQNVRILQADENVLSVQYSDGIARLTKKDLAEDMVNRFQMVDLPPGKTAALPPKPKTAANPPSPAKVKELRDRLAVLDANIRIGVGNLDIWRRRQADYRQRYDSARAMGRSTSITIQLAEAEAAVTACTKQITAAQAQKELTQHELEMLTEPQGN